MLSQTVEYALRAIVYLADQGGATTKRQQISRSTDVPLEYLAKVLQALDRAGIVQAVRGPRGGYSLRLPPEEISVLQVVNAIEPVKRIKECPLGLDEHVDLCPLHARLDLAAAKIEEAYRETKICDLIPSPKRHSNTCPFPRRKLKNSP